MRAVIQRVNHASVRSNPDTPDERTASIGRGLAVLIGFEQNDHPDAPRDAADRIAGLRIFPDDQGRMNLALTDLNSLDPPQGSVLAVPNFTLAARPGKGRRPAFTAAMPPDPARQAFHTFTNALADLLPTAPAAHGHHDAVIGPVAVGRFAAHMLVDLQNDGPVTIILEHPATTSA